MNWVQNHGLLQYEIIKGLDKCNLGKIFNSSLLEDQRALDIMGIFMQYVFLFDDFVDRPNNSLIQDNE